MFSIWISKWSIFHFSSAFCQLQLLILIYYLPDLVHFSHEHVKIAKLFHFPFDSFCFIWNRKFDRCQLKYFFNQNNFQDPSLFIFFSNFFCNYIDHFLFMQNIFSVFPTFFSLLLKWSKKIQTKNSVISKNWYQMEYLFNIEKNSVKLQYSNILYHIKKSQK